MNNTDYFPSVMNSGALPTDKQKIALMVAHAMQTGAELGTRSKDIFSYHARERVSKSAYADNFLIINEGLIKSLTQTSK